MNAAHWWNDTDREELKFLEKNLFQCHFVPTNITWTGLRLKPGLHGDRPATSSLSHGTACIISNMVIAINHLSGQMATPISIKIFNISFHSYSNIPFALWNLGNEVCSILSTSFHN
jgi:hypothetical protein